MIYLFKILFSLGLGYLFSTATTLLGAEEHPCTPEAKSAPQPLPSHAAAAACSVAAVANPTTRIKEIKAEKEKVLLQLEAEKKALQAEHDAIVAKIKAKHKSNRDGIEANVEPRKSPIPSAMIAAMDKMSADADEMIVELMAEQKSYREKLDQKHSELSATLSALDTEMTNCLKRMLMR